MQKTLKSTVKLSGVGLHGGQAATVKVSPADIDSGIVILRSDADDQQQTIPAAWNFAEHSPLCTKLVNDAGVTISTIEHLMAGLAGCGITNAVIDVDGPEVPILDGSSHEFVQAFLDAGIVSQNAPARVLRILKPVRVTHGDAWAELSPADIFRMDFEIDFADGAIGHQKKSLAMANGAFVHELCNSRTFCSNSTVKAMHDAGLALGGTMENAVVFEGDLVLSPGGLRHSDEPVRHKMLDALGDLYLVGALILGAYRGYKAGHTLTNKLLHAVFADDDAYEFTYADDQIAACLPGADVTRGDLPKLA
ncbi:MAG: UDP-3-O-acyl-N-acetylglucosamine deacetylase [Planktomarina sp.]